jgi:hypothetical protein
MTFCGNAASQKLAGGLTFFVRKNRKHYDSPENWWLVTVDFDRPSFPFYLESHYTAFL